jgi:DNA repair exonuclease SbcCD nuclease subunit
MHYLALGDRHSHAEIGSTKRINYSGSPEATDYRDRDAGKVLVVELDGEHVSVTPHTIGQWRFVEITQELTDEPDVDSLEEALGRVAHKDRTIVKLKLQGSVTLRQWQRVERLLDEARDLFAAIEQPERHRDVAIVPEDTDFSDLDLKGYAAQGLGELRQRAQGAGDEAQTARDALALLLRLVGRDA